MHVNLRLALALGWRNLWRDLRAGELRLLIVSVTLAVAALTAVGFFADRLQAGLWRDARQLLGGDAVVVSDQPTPQTVLDEAERNGLVRNTSITFPTMARAITGASKLVALKAVSPGYPLRGQLQLITGSAPAQPASGIPAPGQVWVDAGVLESLGLAQGDALQLGDRRLQISAVIAQEPDRGAGFMNFSPRVMLNQADLAATGGWQGEFRSGSLLVSRVRVFPSRVVCCSSINNLAQPLSMTWRSSLWYISARSRPAV